MADSVQSADKAAIPDDIFCPECSYNLRGTPSDYCPECGYSLANIRSPVCRIPWVKRRELGRFRSYWRTVWMVGFRNRRFCEEVARPVSYADAQAFRWVTIVHAYLPVLLATVLMYLNRPPQPQPRADFFQQLTQMLSTGAMQAGPSFTDLAYAETWLVVILHACFLLFLAAATGAPSYFFHPRSLSVRQRNNTVALSYYSSAPLVLTVLPVIAAGTAFTSADRLPVEIGAVVATLLLALVLLMWLTILACIARQTMPHLKGRRLLIVLSVPLLWVALAVLTLVFFPFAALSVLVVLYSLW